MACLSVLVHFENAGQYLFHACVTKALWSFRCWREPRR